MMSLEKTGTIAFRAGHEDADWLTNNKLYRFQSPTHSGISVEVVKHSDRTLEVTLAGTRQSDTAFRHIVPHTHSMSPSHGMVPTSSYTSRGARLRQRRLSNRLDLVLK
jgi:hypothetical protein